MTSPPSTERVRSFKVRRGRMSERKRDALDRIGPRFRLDVPSIAPFDLDAVFGRRAPVLLDVGFGTGGATLDWAERRPAWDVVAVDVHTAGVAHLLAGLEARSLGNVRVAETDVWDVLDRLPDASITGVRALFPDPWPKRRHHARRLVQATFVERIGAVLTDGGWFQLATDWVDYAAEVVSALDAEPRFEVDPSAAPADARPRPDDRTTTPYEQRGLDAGRTITEVIALRRPRESPPR